MPTQSIFVRDRFLGSREIPALVKGLDGYRPHYSFVFFCPHCGEIWAKFLTEPRGYYQLTSRSCRAHGDGRLTCHPEWADAPNQFDWDWPDAAVEYEFETLLARAEKGMI